MDSPLSHNEIKDILIKLEREWPVHIWRIDGVDIWPYVRIKLYYFFLNYRKGTANKKRIEGQSTRGRRKMRLGLKLPGELLIASFQLYSFFRSLKPKKILFFGSHIHRTKRDGKYFNRFFDPMVDFHNLQNEVYEIEFQKVFQNNYNQKAIIPLHKYLDQYKRQSKISFSLRKRDTLGLPDFDKFFDQLTSEFPEVISLSISNNDLYAWAAKIKRIAVFFEMFYNKTKPEKIIFLSYYGFDDLSAAILAANKLKIKTIDFQHGPQTNVHMAYCHWTKHPKGSFNIMPIEYWNWDRKSKENIDLWARNVENVKAKIVGQPYIGYCLNSDISKKADLIFYSLQTLDLQEMFTMNIIEFIIHGSIPWLLRVHPRSKFQKEELRVFLRSSGVMDEKFIIEDSFEASLPESLARAVVHVTNFSGCLLEAQIQDVTTVLINEAGREMFSNYIDNKSVYYLDSRNREFKARFDEIIHNEKYRRRKNKNYLIANPLET